MRSEAEVFRDLSALCRSDGYAQALAYLCFHNNIVGFTGELRAEDLARLFSPEGLIRSEISTLIGLMIQAEVSWPKPSAEIIQQQIERTAGLLQELHETFRPAMTAVLVGAMKPPNPLSPFKRGDVLREAIFYGGKSAYNFQYPALRCPG